MRTEVCGAAICLPSRRVCVKLSLLMLVEHAGAQEYAVGGGAGCLDASFCVSSSLLMVFGHAAAQEYAAGGELFERIIEAGRLPEAEARFFFQQLISGIAYCHKEARRVATLELFCPALL